jgi:hypothetical protein
MSPVGCSPTGLGCATKTSNQKTITSFFTSYKCAPTQKNPFLARPHHDPLPNTPSLPLSHKTLKQTTLFYFITPKSLIQASPNTPIKNHHNFQASPGGYCNLLDAFNQATTGISPQTHTQITLAPPLRQKTLKQTTLGHFLRPTNCSTSQTKTSNETNTTLPKAPNVSSSNTHLRNVRQALLSYNYGAAYSNNEPTIIPFLHIGSNFDGAWGHSPPQIDQSTIFRLVLQNPNGIKLRKGFQVPLQDLQTCRQFGVATLSLPETNSNWSLPHQQSQLHHPLRSTWSNSVSQVSSAEETFLSSYQPGGTATILCSRWATRVIEKGQDHLGMGRWSCITLRGKQNKKVTIVTVYNCGYSTGLKTACQQQTRILFKLFRNNNLPGTPNPH